jgi:hypothetical protein
MICDPLPANYEILPQVKQGSYFFNRIGEKLPFVTGNFRSEADSSI